MKNPIRGLRFSLLDFQSARAGLGMKLAMAAIAIIPVIYGALYLMAFYDPYGSLDTLPVAVVNEDVGATLQDGSAVRAGDDLVSRLRESNSLKYSFVSEDTAQRGIEDGSYYLKVVIPKDFSKDIASAEENDPTQAKLVFVANESTNYLSSILGKSVFREVTAQTNYAVGDNYYVQLFDKVDQSGRDIKRAADGAFDLEDGLGQVSEGADQLSNGAKKAQKGSTTLSDGISSAADGSQTITNKLQSAKQGSDKLSDGLDNARSGSSTLTGGLAQAQSGAMTLGDGLGTLADGLEAGERGSKELAAGLGRLQDGSGQLALGARSLETALSAQGASLNRLNTGAADVSRGVDDLVGTLSGFGGTLEGLSQQTKGLQTKLDALEQSASSLQDAGTKLQSDASSAKKDIQNVRASLSGMSEKLGSVGQDVGAASEKAASAAQAAAKAQEELEGIEPTANEDGSYTLTATQYATFRQAQRDVRDASGEAAESAQDARSAGQSLKGVGNAVEGLSDQGLTDRLMAVSDDLTAIQKGAPALFSGAQSLLSEASSTILGARTLTGRLSSDMGRLGTLQGGAKQVSDGINALTKAMTTDAYDVDGKALTLHAGVRQLADGSRRMDESLPALVVGANKLTVGTRQLAEGAKSARGGSDSLASALGLLSNGSKTLSLGLGSADGGSHSLSSGLGLLVDGSSTLTSGLYGAKSGALSLTDGLGTLSAGAGDLALAVDTARDGSAVLADGLEKGYESATEQTQGADRRASMMSQPVTLADDPYTTVANYGTGFAPYFIALGLWVGALVMTFLLRPLNKRLICSGASPVVAAFSGLVPWLIIGALQSVILGLVVQFPLRLDIIHVAAYYALILLASVVFCTMIQMITAVLGFPGKFVAVILLMLQLTSAAGTFPIQTEPEVFQAISPYVPMTYVVHSLRIAMRGTDLGLVGPDVVTLVLFAGVSFMITCLAARRRRLVTMNDLHPLVDL